MTVSTAHVGAFFRRDFRLAVAYPLQFTMQWVSIAIAVFGAFFISKLVPNSTMFGLGHHGSYFEYAVVNLAFFSIMQVTMQSVDVAIRNDQMLGTIEATLASSPNVATYVLASMAWPLALATAQAVGYLGLAALLFGAGQFAHANIPLTLLCFVLIVTAMVPVGVLSSCFTLRFKQAAPAQFLVGSGMSLVSGVLFPIALLPFPVRVISWLIPVTHALNAMRAALHGAPVASVTGDIVWLAAVSVLGLPAALWLFRKAVHAERAAGTLAQY